MKIRDGPGVEADEASEDGAGAGTRGIGRNKDYK